MTKEANNKKILIVYVSQVSQQNLRHGLDNGIWGFKPTATGDGLKQVTIGDTIVLAFGASKGPRISDVKWLEGTLRSIYVATITSQPYADHTPEWPDETEKDSADRYSNRIRFDARSLTHFENVQMSDYGAHKPFFEAIRLSGTKQCSGIILPAIENPFDNTYENMQNDIDKLAQDFYEDVRSVHLSFDKSITTRLTASLLSKPFLILTGLSGSGKTKLAVSFAQWLAPTCYKVIPVGADWTGNENILGYPDGLSHHQFNTTPILDLILEATDNPKQPYFLILDEMNLSHVERYFSDILSCIESGECLSLYSGKLDDRLTWRKSPSGASITPQIPKFPTNLFIIGTVNIDETTYMFSPKVLDRAHVIEFRVSNTQIKQFLSNPKKPNMSPLLGKGTQYGHSFVSRSQTAISCSENLQNTLQSELLTFFNCLTTVGAEFGFRTALEMVRFVGFYIELSGTQQPPITEPIDFVILQKLLPKLHGSRTKLAPVLKQLWYLCTTPVDSRNLIDNGTVLHNNSQANSISDPSSVVPSDAPYPESAEKISRMWKLLHANGFTSFAEA
jgi:5-methylcytosine-specific restriction protein B